MRWTGSRLWMLLVAVFLVCTVAAEAAAEPKQEVLMEEVEISHELSNDHAQSDNAALLVQEALDILYSLDPAPARHGASDRSTLSWIFHILRQVLLWHNPETLEQKPHSDLPVGAHGRKLRTAVEKLEAARQLKSADAVYFLAEMNFYGNWSHPRDYETAFERYKELADISGEAGAQNMVGFLYATGFGGAVQRDQAKALLYHTFAALNGDTRSEMTVAFRHHTGIGTPRNCDEAAFYYKRVADKAIQWWESGPPGGQHIQKHTFRLADDDGGVYGEGASAISSGMNAIKRHQSLDQAKELEDVVEYLELLARKGNTQETFALGKLYYDGTRNLPRNVARAKLYFKNVAKEYWAPNGKVIAGGPPKLEAWAARAAGYLGTMALRGEAGPQDFAAARRWFTRGVNSGDAGSHNGLGLLALHGYGVTKDRQKAAEHFTAATEQDHAMAQVNLAKLLLEDEKYEVAKRYFELAARHGNIEAFYYLAEINHATLKSGGGSCPLATAYYKIVAERAEDLQAPLEWAHRAYGNGDVEGALAGFMMAAEQGYESGQANVAYLLDRLKSAFPLRKLLPAAIAEPAPTTTSLAAAPDASNRDELALIYWTRSAKQGSTDSLVKMGDYYLSGVGVAGSTPDAEKAASCYQAASELQASAQALWNLGWMHENGVGVAQDFHLAKRFYDLALETNHEAYLPVTLSLLKLRARAAWNTLTNGGVNDAAPPGSDEENTRKPLSLSEFLRNWYAEAEAAADYDDGEVVGVAPDGSTDADYGYDDVAFEDDLAESVVILALAAAVALLMFYRQWRQQGLQRRQEEERRRQRGEAVAAVAGAAGGAGVPAQPDLGLNQGIWGDGVAGWGMPH